MRHTSICIAVLAACSNFSQAAELRLSGPYNHDNLSIYLVHGQDPLETRYLTLFEALEQHKVAVYETGSVNRLEVENLSKEDIYIQSGEIVKGGRQDRVLKDDIILPTASGRVDITAFCVEHGRWTQRGSEPSRAFAGSPNAIASPQMKRAVQQGQQSAVWAEVSAAQDRLARNLAAPVKSVASESSYQLTLEAPKVKKVAAGFSAALGSLAATNADALGYVLVVNGKVTGADVYGSHELFRKLWPKLLDSAAVEAMAAARPGEKFAPPSMADVRSAATGYGAPILEERKLNRRTSSVRAELPQGVVLETRDSTMPTAPIHRSYVTK